MEIEKIIKWLECCGNYDEYLNHVGCTEKCPYYANSLSCDPVAPFQDTLNLLKGQPEIVRCKDCKNWVGNGADIDELPYWLPCKVEMRRPDYFCADGKRKDT